MTRAMLPLLCGLLAGLFCMGAAAAPAGERHGLAPVHSAAVRDAGQRDDVRYTVWYPTLAAATPSALTIGPDAQPLFVSGQAAVDAPIAGGRLPTLLLSHGNGGSARMMGWLGTALASAGYLVIAVDHPGNNGADAMTVPGSVMAWLRADDLKAALAAVQSDPQLAPHVDAGRLGVVGFSAGGFTALLAAGARPDMARLLAYCRAHDDDGVCQPQPELPSLTLQAREAAMASAALAPLVRHAGDDRGIPGVRALFLLAPAIVQAFDPAQLQAITQPVSVLLGSDDTLAPPASNGEVIAALVPNAHLQRIDGAGHYAFLAGCTPPARERLGPLCTDPAVQAKAHQQAIAQSLAFFARVLP